MKGSNSCVKKITFPKAPGPVTHFLTEPLRTVNRIKIHVTNNNLSPQRTDDFGGKIVRRLKTFFAKSNRLLAIMVSLQMV